MSTAEHSSAKQAVKARFGKVHYSKVFNAKQTTSLLCRATVSQHANLHSTANKVFNAKQTPSLLCSFAEMYSRPDRTVHIHAFTIRFQDTKQTRQF